MAGLTEQNQIRGLEERLNAIEAGGGVSGGTGLLEPLTPRVDELTEIYTHYAFDKQYINYLYLNNPVTLTVPPYLESPGKPDIEKSRFDLFYIYLPSNTLNVLTGEEAETPVLPGTPANGLFVGFGLIHGDGSYEVGTAGTENVIYVGKGGDNSKDGRSSENRVLTFGRAMEIKALNPDFSIFCKDSGFYNENLTIDLDSYSLEIFAPNASFAGTWVCAGDGQFTFNAKRHTGSISMTNESSLVLNEGIHIEQITLNLSASLKCGFAEIATLTANDNASIYCSHIRGTFNYTDIETLTIKGRINDEQYPTVGHTILDNGTAKVSRANLNFKGFSLSDDENGNATIIEGKYRYTIAFFNTLLPCPVLHSAAETLTLVKDAAINVVEYSTNNGTAWTAYNVPVAVAANSETLWRVSSFNTGYDKGCLILNIS